MMRIGQHSPPVLDKSTQTREATSPVTQKTAPTAPLPSTPAPAGGGLPPAQSHFNTPTRPATPAQGRNFVTPPPPGKGKSGAKVSSEQQKQALSSAIELVYGKGKGPEAHQLAELQGKAQKLAEEGQDYTAIKFALHGELTALKTGEPVPTSPSSGSGSSAAADYIKQSVFGGAMGMPSSLGASPALFGKTADSKVSAPAAQQVSPEQQKQALSSAIELVYGKGKGPEAHQLAELQNKAQKLAKEGQDYTTIKFALHGELTALKTGEPVPTSPSSGSGSAADTKVDASAVQVSPEQQKQALSSAIELVYGKGKGPEAHQLAELQNKAQKLAKEGQDYTTIKFALHGELTALKTGEPVPTSPSSGSGSSAATDYIKQSVFGGAMGMPSSLGASSALFGKTANVKVSSSTPASAPAPLRQAVDDMHQLVFGMKASGSSAQELMTHAQGLGATHGNDFGAIRNALHSLLTGKSAPAGGSPAPLSKDRLTQAMNEASQLVFGANPSAAKAIHLMGRALELAGQLQQDFHAVKFALHSQLSGKPMPAPGGAHPTPTDPQLRQALDDAHQVAFKQAAGGPHLNAWMDEARQLAAHHGNDLQAVKLALHSQMLEAK